MILASNAVEFPIVSKNTTKEAKINWEVTGNYARRCIYLVNPKISVVQLLNISSATIKYQ